MRRTTRVGIVISAFASMLPQASQAGDIVQLRTFKVNDTVDAVDAAPGDGICNANVNPDLPSKCTLRAAIMEGNTFGDGWRIQVELVPGKTYPLTLVGALEQQSRTGDLDVLRPMRIGIPKDADALATINAFASDRALDFRQTPGISVIYGVRLVNGYGAGSTDGDALYTTAQVLSAQRVEVNENAKVKGTNGVITVAGGRFSLLDSDIHDNGTVKGNGDVDFIASALVIDGGNTEVLVERSAIRGNAGYGVLVRGGASLIMSGSTVSNNRLPGISAGRSSVLVQNSTLVDNAVSPGGGSGQLRTNATPEKPAIISLNNSILGSSEGVACSIQAGDAVSFHTAYNIYSDLSCVSDVVIDHSLHATPAGLSEIGDWGGPTPVHLPLPGSPAIDRAPASMCDQDGSDQRGMPRPVRHEGGGEPRCDTGAVELEAIVIGEPLGTLIFADGLESD